MNLRNLSLTVAALVALSAVVWFARRPAPSAAADPRIGQPVLASDLARKAARVTVADAGRSVEVARGSDGTWTVPSYHELPADFAKLSRLIADLGETKIRRLVTTRPESLARLEFKDASIRLADESNQEFWKLTLGKTAEGGGRFLRYGDEPKGYQAPLSLWLDAEPKNWADPVLLDLKAGDIARIEIGFPAGAPVVAAREKADSPWTSPATPEGRRLKADRVDAALSGVLTLRFTETLAPDDPQVAAARPHSRTLKLTTFGGSTYALTFSRKPEEKRPKPPAANPEKPASGDVTAPAAGTTAAAAPGPDAAAATPAPAAPGDSVAPPAGDAGAKPAEPELETIPAGPVFVAVSSSDPAARINALMQKRAFQIGEWTYTGLPASPEEFWEQTPAETPTDRPAAPEAPKS